MAMRVMVVKYGYTVIDTDNEEDAIEQTKNMSDSDFDWSDFDDIALCKIGDKKYEYDDVYDNYMHHIIPGVLSLFYL